MKWSPQLLEVLLEELRVDDSFAQLVGEPSELPRSRYPQAIAVAILLAHSWRPEDLRATARRIEL